mmetsp:Transcript_21693/g.73163  ORF Transcript_21693/g.73163 Transcript_21693/m.73163 type:complete len:428 (+) Transcript_21693:41-1324(+)
MLKECDSRHATDRWDREGSSVQQHVIIYIIARPPCERTAPRGRWEWPHWRERPLPSSDARLRRRSETSRGPSRGRRQRVATSPKLLTVAVVPVGVQPEVGRGGNVRGAAHPKARRRRHHRVRHHLGEELRHGVGTHVCDADAARDGEDRRAGAGEEGAVRARLEGVLYDWLEREHVLAVLLVEPILHRHPQRVELRRGEAVDQHRGARDVEDRVLAVDLRGQHGARLGGRHLVVGDEENALQPVGDVHPLRDPVALGVEGDLEAAVDGGRHVVGVPLLVCGELQQQLLVGRRRHVLATQRQPGREPRHQRRGRRAHPARRRHRVLALEPQRRHLLAERVQHLADALHDEVVLGQRDPPLPLPLHHHLEPVRLLHDHAVPDVERKAKRVEAGPQVGRRGGNVDHDAVDRVEEALLHVGDAGGEASREL